MGARARALIHSYLDIGLHEHIPQALASRVPHRAEVLLWKIRVLGLPGMAEPRFKGATPGWGSVERFFDRDEDDGFVLVDHGRHGA